MSLNQKVLGMHLSIGVLCVKRYLVKMFFSALHVHVFWFCFFTTCAVQDGLQMHTEFITNISVSLYEINLIA